MKCKLCEKIRRWREHRKNLYEKRKIQQRQKEIIKKIEKGEDPFIY